MFVSAISFIGGTAQAATVTIGPSADAVVKKDTPNTNYGTAIGLKADNSPVEMSFLKFTVAGTGSTVTGAKLRLFISDPSTLGGQFRRVQNTTWAENTINWSNAPAADSTVIASVGSASMNTFVDVDVFSVIKGDGTYSFRIDNTSSDAVIYASREVADTTHWPQLVLTTDGTTPPPPPTPPTTPPPGTADSFEFAAVGDMNPSGNTSTTSASGRNAASIAAGLNDGSLHNFIGIGDFQYDKGTCSALPAWNSLWGGVKAKTFWTAGPGHDIQPGVNDDLDRFMNGECVSTTKSATSTTLGRFQDALEWYATDQGNWHIVFAPTAAWLYNATRAQAMTAEMDADMKAATTAGRHLAVVYHDPYFTSDTSAHTRFTQAKPWIDMFWANRVKVLLSGSQHNYERTCPVNNADQCVTDGMQQFQVSTGGIGLRSFTSNPAYVQRKFSDTWGHLRMSLKPDGSYTWEFRPVLGGMQTDSGSRASGTTPPPPGDTTAPTVTGTSPAGGATGVAVAANVTGTFSEAMDAATITSATFTLQAGTTAVPAAVTYNSTDRVATLNPDADLAAGATYTATIKGGAGGVKDVAGNALVSDRTWTFTTAAAGGTSETVTLTPTADSYVSSGSAGTNFGTANILRVDASPVEATYLKFDLSPYAGRTLQSAVLQLRVGGNPSTGTQNVKLVTIDTWTEGGITFNNRPALGTGIGTFGPTTANTNLSVPLTVSGLTAELGQLLSLGMDTASSDGLELSSKEAGTTTAPKLVLTLSPGGGGGDTTAPTVTGTSPAGGATGVAVAANVTGTFSEAMDAATITSATFTLQAGTTAVPAAVTYNSTDRVATLNPDADLAAGATYTATIKGGAGGVKDVAGNALVSDRTWTFTTAAAGGTSETVTLTPTADSYVSSGSAGTNFGTANILRVDASPVEATYLKFDLSPYAGRTLQSAVLQLRVGGNPSTGTQNVKLVTIDTWTEGGITFNNRPALGTGIGTFGPTTANTNLSVPLTVSGLTAELGQLLSLGMDTASSDGLELSSKEAGTTTAPKLVLTLSQ
ncbi:CBM96 family carbohydrate-binding protein [Arthrobacter globiformis]|uniref:CBM96 family carbohydrate-binding protein n=1 Tax=Arthrobacter globiformis TaxID=1665 RepID=UPI0027D914C6|nr:DNRLRE domain-containing protein [Arthrobacter globiformis]